MHIFYSNPTYAYFKKELQIAKFARFLGHAMAEHHFSKIISFAIYKRIKFLEFSRKNE